jgi:hypothetical protein
MKQQRIGRIRRPEARKPGERATLSLRIGGDLWHRLDRAASAIGRSLSAEAEFRLQRSFSVEDALAGPARQVVHHLIGAFGSETDINNPAEYLAAMTRVIEALASRYPGLFGFDQMRDATLTTMDIAAANEHRALQAKLQAQKE